MACCILLLSPLWGLALFLLFPLQIALPLYLAIVGISLLTWWVAMRALRAPAQTGPEALAGREAVVVEDVASSGTVRMNGELWSAEADQPIPAGTRVRVLGVEGLRLRVEALGEEVEHPWGSGTSS